MGHSITCPDCASTDIRPSSSKNLWERLYAFSGFKPYFCENCYLRFFAKLTSPGPGGDGDQDEYAEVRTVGPRVRPAYIVFALAVIVAVGLGLGLLQTGGPSARIDAAPDSANQGVKPLPKLADAQEQAASPAPTPAQPDKSADSAEPPVAPQTSPKPTEPAPAVLPKPVAKPAPMPPPVRTPAVVKPPPPVKPSATAKLYTIQLGAFSTADKAAQFKARLAKKGVSARIDRQTNPDGKLWFKVRVGTYSSRDQARQALTRMSKKTGIKAYITLAE